MHLLIMMANMFISRCFGFRHRPIAEDLTIYRPLDMIAGCFLSFLVIGLGGLMQRGLAYLIPIPSWINTLGGILGIALVIFSTTTWMPFLEHLSSSEPGAFTSRGRRLIVLLARVIPYLYVLVALGFAALIASMIYFSFALLFLGIASLFAIDIGGSQHPLVLWIIGGIWFVLGLVITRLIIIEARAHPDWGLPTWQTFVENGTSQRAGSILFDLLDSSIGHLVEVTTRPTPQMQERAQGSTPKTLLDYRRFDGDLIDIWIGMCGATIVVSIVVSIASAVLRVVAPATLARLTEAPAPSAAGGAPAARPTEFLIIVCLALIFIPTLLGCVALLRRLAERSSDQDWASRRWVQWLATIFEWVRLGSCALIAIALGAIAAAVIVTVTGLGTIGGIVIFSIVALMMGWLLLHTPISDDSYLQTFLLHAANARQRHASNSSSQD